MPDTTGITSPNAAGATNTQGLADWAAPYVTNYLGQAQALSQQPYQAYQGPLTAGASNLQTQAFQGIGALTVPSGIGSAANTAGNIAGQATGMAYTPTTTSFGVDQAQQYMNPYLQASLNPQLEEARRQSQITAQQNAAKMTQAGAFGGSRQALMDAENQRNLGTNLANITGQGYNTAYTNAMQQFNADQARKAQEAQFGANFGIQGLQTGLQAAQAQGSLSSMQNQAQLGNINAQLAAGAQERGITSEGVAADKAEFEAQRQFPYQQVQFQRDMMTGLPISSITNQQASLSGLPGLISAVGGIGALNTALGTTDLTSTLQKLGINIGG